MLSTEVIERMPTRRKTISVSGLVFRMSDGWEVFILEDCATCRIVIFIKSCVMGCGA